jgi:hypothetical protein
MNYIFQYVDKSRITTGLLSDYGLYMVEPDVFNGVPADVRLGKFSVHGRHRLRFFG